MDPVGKLCGKLRHLAVTLERETAQLQRALNEEEEDFEDSPMRILHGLHLEVETLKDDVNSLLDKSHSERQESNSFIKNTKLLMERNKMNITKIRDLFQKYGYKPNAMEDPDEETSQSKNLGRQYGKMEKPQDRSFLLPLYDFRRFTSHLSYLDSLKWIIKLVAITGYYRDKTKWV